VSPGQLAARVPAMDDAALEKALLLAVSVGDVTSDEFAEQSGVDHKKVIGLMKSLEASALVRSSAVDRSALALTPESETYVVDGSPEAQAFHAVPADGCSLAEFKQAVSKTVAEVGFKQAMQSKWLGMVKGGEPRVERKVDAINEDTCQTQLKLIQEGKAGDIDPKDLESLIKKRKLVKQDTWKVYVISKGAEFSLERKKQPTDLTREMLQDGTWRDETFKAYNLVPGAGAMPSGGHVHPLLKVRQQFRETFLQLGFAEMPTNNFVESGFWNFDTLIQPQMHPARDAHDTFFMKTPAVANRAPED
jgi:phenylalanyl-tRNA synthetase alpha chain